MLLDMLYFQLQMAWFAGEASPNFFPVIVHVRAALLDSLGTEVLFAIFCKFQGDT